MSAATPWPPIHTPAPLPLLSASTAVTRFVATSNAKQKPAAPVSASNMVPAQPNTVFTPSTFVSTREERCLRGMALKSTPLLTPSIRTGGTAKLPSARLRTNMCQRAAFASVGSAALDGDFVVDHGESGEQTRASVDADHVAALACEAAFVEVVEKALPLGGAFAARQAKVDRLLLPVLPPKATRTGRRSAPAPVLRASTTPSSISAL